jgi:hypothetical protein
MFRFAQHDTFVVSVYESNNCQHGQRQRGDRFSVEAPTKVVSESKAAARGLHVETLI